MIEVCLVTILEDPNVELEEEVDTELESYFVAVNAASVPSRDPNI